MIGLSRRTFLASGTALTLAACAGVEPPRSVAPPRAAAPATPDAIEGANKLAVGPAPRLPPGRTLVLVELAGGNDGLNTLVPYADPLYAKLRPRSALAADEITPLNEQLGLHPGLVPLLPAWEKGELAIVLGVGYPRPNLSHFRSIEIWETASDSEEFLQEGWLSRAIGTHPILSHRSGDADAIVIGDGSAGTIMGPTTRIAAMVDPRSYVLGASQIRDVADRPASSAVTHLIRTQRDAAATADRLRAKITGSGRYGRVLPGTVLGRRLANVADVIADGVDVPVIKVTLPGFDHHISLRPRHDPLMTQLGAALAGFRSAMIDMGYWKNTLVVVFSEFGRRPAENESNGTDHGTAGPMFVTGGAVAGGFHGRQPSLEDLDFGNLKHHVDFRQVYAGVLKGWWGLEQSEFTRRGFAPLELFGQRAS
ncbi:MAG: DUF1501 domain-containing protein [Alphaproteobacteria bacterium]|nr:DUF1501 domain-containing protein [Alphaproteobacteria bacterium]